MQQHIKTSLQTHPALEQARKGDREQGSKQAWGVAFVQRQATERRSSKGVEQQ